MAIDIIVFSQDELDRAVSEGYRSICLCDGEFILPDIRGICYTQIGSVTILGGTAAAHGAVSVSSYASSYMSSYVTSYVTSYTTSYITSYVTRYEYEYEYASSGSYVTSYLTSYVTSYVSSYVSSFRTPAQEGGEECIMVNGYGINLI